MNREPVIARADVTVTEIARLMHASDVGGVIVMEGREPIGILTERDIVRKVVASGRDADETRVGDVMTRDLIVTSPGVDVADVAALMAANGVRRLPVVAEAGLVGVVTDRDLLAVSPALFDLAREQVAIARGHRRPVEGDTLGPGTCEACGTGVDVLVVVDGSALCDECMDAES